MDDRRNRVITPGAQTGHRGEAGTVRNLLGGKDPTGRFFQARTQSSLRIVPRPLFLVNSALLLSPNRSR